TAASATGLTVVLLLLAGSLSAQTPPFARPPFRPDTTKARPPSHSVPCQTLDTAKARKLVLPTGPTRSFPASDPVMDSLMKLPGFRLTQYVADTLVVQGADNQTIPLRGEGFVGRERST